MFIKEPKFANSFGVTRNPNKFGEDVILSLESNGDTMAIRMNKDDVRKLYEWLMETTNE